VAGNRGELMNKYANDFKELEIYKKNEKYQQPATSNKPPDTSNQIPVTRILI